MVWIVVLVIVGLLVIGLVTLYNRFVTLRNRVDNAWAQIEVQLKQRWDHHPEPRRDRQGLRRARARHLRGGHRGARERPAGAGPAETAAAEGILGAALGRLFAVAEAYPSCRLTRTSASSRTSSPGRRTGSRCRARSTTTPC